jgi:hypothetical protein
MPKSPFRYPDTNSAKAEIEDLNLKFTGLKIGIIGLGGTGSYVLDLVAKIPVEEIHLFDDNPFELNNAFRSPGAPDGEMLDERPDLKKVIYFSEIYSRMHTGIIPHEAYINADNLVELSSLDFVFLCVDKNKARSMIIKGLLTYGVPFIDVGLGIEKKNDHLIGTIRVTTGSGLKNDHLSSRIGDSDAENKEYASNIQIADLNCLNGALAVIKWKRIVGFYQDLKKEHNTLWFVSTNSMLNEDFVSTGD